MIREWNCMRLAGAFLRAANALVSFVVALCLCTAGLYSVYALWDNNRVYSAAEDVRADMMKLKPVVVEDNGLLLKSFWQSIPMSVRGLL